MKHHRLRRVGLPFAVAWAVFASVGCEPLGPLPGGALSGQVVPEPVTDWSFTDPHDTIEIETRPEDPHSVTVWCVSQSGRLYVPSRHPEKKRWVQHVLEDPHVRVRVGDQIHPATIARVTDPAEIEAVVPVLVRKYDLDPPGPDDEKDVWLFRVESPPAD